LSLDFLGAYDVAFAVLALVGLLGLGAFFVARLFRGNASHGIVDDGTGVAILLELAKHLKSHPIPDTQFTFGFFGAEEAGLVGSTYYYLHRAVDRAKLRVITIDMIGEKPPLAYVKGIFLIGKRRMGAAFNQQIAEIAQALDIEIKGKTFPYPGSDFGHFLLDAGCTTNWLINRSRIIHSKQDNLSNLNPKLVQDALKLMVAYLSSRPADVPPSLSDHKTIG
jgi:putative aminopeptidase FrvX